MYKTRLPRLIIGAALVLAGLIALLTFGPSAGAKNSSHSYVGIGDLRRFEVEQSI